MTRMIASLVLGVAVFAVLYLSAVRPSRHPLLIDAAFPGDWCDVSNPPPLPRVKSPIEPRGTSDQRTIA